MSQSTSVQETDPEQALPKLPAFLLRIYSKRDLLLPLALCFLGAAACHRLLDQMPGYYDWLQAAAWLGLGLVKVVLWRRDYPRLNRALNLFVYYLTAAFTVLILINLVARLMIFTDYYGFEYLLQEYGDNAFWLFCLICFLQPILLPVPEPVTILAGSAILGAPTAFIASYLGTVGGIVVMYSAARYGGGYLCQKKGRSKALERYYHYVDRFGVWILLLLLIFPVLPDEIICLGAGLSRIPPKRFLPIVAASKLASSFCLAFLPELFI